MKRMNTWLAMLAVAMMPFLLTSCDPDDGWDYYDYYGGWYDNYDWYHSPFDYGTAQMIQMAQYVNGEWGGTITVSDRDGVYTYGSDFGFYQYNRNSLNGSGVEYRYRLRSDGSYGDDTMTDQYNFTWYIDPRTRNRYLRYDGGECFVIYYADLDLSASIFDASMHGLNINEDDELSLDRYTRAIGSGQKTAVIKMGKKATRM